MDCPRIDMRTCSIAQLARVCVVDQNVTYKVSNFELAESSRRRSRSKEDGLAVDW